MRWSTQLVTLVAVELGVAGLSLVHQLKLRPSVADAFHDFGTPPPVLTRLALEPWLQPAALGFAALMTLLALALPLKKSRRHTLAATGLLALSTVAVFGIVAAVVPIFDPR